jgi:uncharacterized protein with von Willebrand factor type A (vWA) domain
MERPARHDLAQVAAGFGRLLRDAGLPTTPEQAGRFAQAVVLLEARTLEELYWAGRVTFAAGPEAIAVYDRVFAQVFGGAVDPADWRGAAPPAARAGPRPAPRGARDQPGPAVDPTGSVPDAALSFAAGAPRAEDDGRTTREVRLGLASREERLATTDFGALDEAELARLRWLMEALRVAPPLRRGRRPRRHRRGERVDLRATLRRSHRTGGDPLVHIRRRPIRRPRRVVLLCDISGSMAPYSRAALQFLHAAASGTRAEAFTFATRLTRVTRALADRQPAVALAAAAAAAPDWRGGTRIGDALKLFLDGYGRRGVARGAVVVIVSDGWECGPPDAVAEQMARLRRLAYRIVWINPRSADARYRPLAAGMAAALPYCDRMVSGHNAAALAEVVAAIGEISGAGLTGRRASRALAGEPGPRPLGT